MKSLRNGAFVLLLLALALTRVPAQVGMPANPHQSMSAAGACPSCHANYSGSMDPHGFVVEIVEICAACHSPKDLGRSHPIGVDLRHSPGAMEVPEDLPLEEGKISCGSCHNPHMAFLSTTRAYADQQATFLQKEGRVEVPWYKTFFLRKSDPVKGFEPLCVACHKDY